MSDKNGEESQRKMMELGMMENTLKQIDQQLGAIEQQILQDKSLEISLDELGKNGKSEAVFPFGGGIFINGSVEKIKNVLVSIGSGIIVEKDIENAKKFLQERIGKMSSAKEQLGIQVEEILSAATNVEKGIRESQK